MNIGQTRLEISECISRLVKTSLSVQQFTPSTYENSESTILGLPSSANYSIAMKNIPYSDIYNELNRNNSFHIKMIDGALISFQYLFTSDGTTLKKHILSFFPSPELPSQEEHPILYETNDIYIDLLQSNIVRFPVRFDFDPSSFKEVIHPKSHATFGQYMNCRIPVDKAVAPNKFIMFLLRNFYSNSYVRNKNTFEKKSKWVSHPETITPREREISHIAI